MNDFMTYFMAGFADDQATKISKRKNDAQDYFEKQMEIARTRGLEAREKNKVAMNEGLTSAKQLMAMGAPQDLVMAIANQSPDDLNAFSKQIAQAQTDGIETDEEFFRDLIRVNGELNTGSTDLVGLFGKIYQPLRNNVKADPEGYKNDKRGTLWATMMGYDAQDRAMDRLETIEVIGGETAADLLAYDRRAEGDYGKPLGDATVTLNYGLLGDRTRAAAESQKGVKPISIAETNTIMKTFESVKDGIRNRMGITADDQWDQTKEPEINRQAAAQVMEMYGENAHKVMQIPEIASILGGEDESVPEAEAPSVAAPAAPTTERTLALPTGETFIEDFGDGTSSWRAADGTPKRYKNSDLKKYGFNVGG